MMKNKRNSNLTTLELIVFFLFFTCNLTTIFFQDVVYNDNRIFIFTMVYVNIVVLVFYFLNFKKRNNKKYILYYTIIITSLVISLIGVTATYLWNAIN